MSHNTYKIRDLFRIGGEAEFLVLHKDGIIVDSYFIARAPVRGFEKMLIGKNPIFAIEAAMRICGICHSAHGINAAEAIENALGIFPPLNGVILREIVGLLNRIQSHILHLALITPDLVKPELKMDAIRREVDLLGMISNVLAKFGGAPSHPPNIVIGGVESMPKQRYIDDSVKTLQQFKQKFGELMEFFENENNWSERAKILAETEFRPKLLASHLYYGDQTNIDLNKIRTVSVEEFRGNNSIPKEAKGTTTLIALYGDEPVEVGPRARLALFWGFNDRSLIGVQRARMREITMGIERILRLIDELDPTEPTKTTAVVFRRGKGISVFEAPRGLLIHYAEINAEGRISFYKIVVPTMFNIPIMEIASRGIPVECADVIPRLYDPCIPCATHLVEVR